MRHLRILIILVISPHVCSVYGPATAADNPVDVEALLKRAVKVDTQDKAYQTVEIKGYYHHSPKRAVGFHIVSEKPGRFVVASFDKEDGVPYFLFDSNQAIIYNPLTLSVNYLSKQAAYSYFRRDETGVEYWTVGREFGEFPNQLVLDMPSLFAKPYKSLTAEPMAPNVYRITLVSIHGNRIEAILDLEENYPIRHLEVITKEEVGPWLCLETIRVNRPIKKETLQFPTRVEIEKHMKVIDLKSQDMAVPDAMRNAERNVAVRSAIYSKELRRPVEALLYIKPDWDQLLKDDALAVKSFKQFLNLKEGVGRITTSQDQQR